MLLTAFHRYFLKYSERDPVILFAESLNGIVAPGFLQKTVGRKSQHDQFIPVFFAQFLQIGILGSKSAIRSQIDQ